MTFQFRLQVSSFGCSRQPRALRRPKLETRNLNLHSSSFRRPASVVRNGRDIPNRAHFNSRGSQRAHRRLSARSWTAHPHVHASDAMIPRHVRGIRCRLLRGERCSFARPAKPQRSRTLPRQNVPIHVRNRHDRVIEGCLHVSQPMRHVLALLLFKRLLFAFFVGRGSGAARCCWFCHSQVSVLSSQFSVTSAPETENWEPRTGNWFYVFAADFFFCATVPLRGPLRVRALVCVRCPRTGRFRRCRNPR